MLNVISIGLKIHIIENSPNQSPNVAATVAKQNLLMIFFVFLVRARAHSGRRSKEVDRSGKNRSKISEI